MSAFDLVLCGPPTSVAKNDAKTSRNQRPIACLVADIEDQVEIFKPKEDHSSARLEVENLYNQKSLPIYLEDIRVLVGKLCETDTTQVQKTQSQDKPLDPAEILHCRARMTEPYLSVTERLSLRALRQTLSIFLARSQHLLTRSTWRALAKSARSANKGVTLLHSHALARVKNSATKVPSIFFAVSKYTKLSKPSSDDRHNDTRLQSSIKGSWKALQHCRDIMATLRREVGRALCRLHSSLHRIRGTMVHRDEDNIDLEMQRSPRETLAGIERGQSHRSIHIHTDDVRTQHQVDVRIIVSDSRQVLIWFPEGTPGKTYVPVSHSDQGT